MNSPLDNLLSRLENVRECGKGYRADCPIGHRSKQTLSVAMKDGMLLVHCHANCPKLEILHTINLTLADLYERPTETAKTPRPSWQQRELMKMRQWKACRSDFVGEVNVLLSVAGQAYHGYPVSEEDKVRIERAARIIRRTLEYL
mgnify:CR=1 FL=1